MKTAYYMTFLERMMNLPDVVGGTPPRLPSTLPTCQTCGTEMAFLAQFRGQRPWLDLGDAAYIQLYQCPQVDDGCDPEPVLVALLENAPTNPTERGVLAPGVEPHGIEWEAREDPDVVPLEPAVGGGVQALYESKAGGAMPFLDALPAGEECVLQLREHPAGLNFGGLRAAVLRAGSGALSVVLV